MRKGYEMSEADLAKLIEAMRPQPVMYLSGGMPLFKSVQENANEAWAELGSRLGFDYMTVRPNGKGDRFFDAEPKELKAKL
jgi:hypothetical protein